MFKNTFLTEHIRATVSEDKLHTTHIVHIYRYNTQTAYNRHLNKNSKGGVDSDYVKAYPCDCRNLDLSMS